MCSSAFLYLGLADKVAELPIVTSWCMWPSAAPQWHFASHWCKGKVSLCSPLTQGQGLTMLSFDPRVHPHYLCPWCKGKVLLHSPLTQGQDLTMLILDPRVSQKYPHPWCKGKVSLHSPLLQEANSCFTRFAARPPSYLCITLYYTTTFIYLHLISFINISVWTKIKSI